ncbi:hypothetical protein L8C07_05655 [Paenibacillus sp. CMAA1739]|uniref:hypothetical protein n=1 Tax=Paenibacillus TaxID=44249 RepID=UPI0007AB853B|nr:MULTISPECIES: hypothetical protein [Paenibacillus]KZE65089.1 hypothetical protein AV545_03980 [Paenibacillus jamilae]MEC4565424.1 hypothetical protein [Paenibacillus sp. CMAA1739]
MKLTDTIKVVKREGKKIHDQAIMLQVGEIKAFKSETKNGRTTLIYLTDDGEYIDETRVDQTMRLFQELPEFEKVSRGSMVQIGKIEHIDEKSYKIYVNRLKNSFVDVTAIHLKKILSYFKR